MITIDNNSNRAKDCFKQQSELVSIVIPVYRNSDTLNELYDRICNTFKGKQYNFEMVFVNDACPAGSLAVLESIARDDSRVAVLGLDHNVGQQKAVLIGLMYSKGNWIVIMDADLQDPPESVPLLLSKGLEGFAAVFAGRRGRYESISRLFCSKLFKGILFLLTGVPADAGIFVAFNRHMLDRILSMGGTRPFIVTMIGCAGLPIVSIPVERSKRPTGYSAYNFRTRFKSASRALTWIFEWKWYTASCKFNFFKTISENYLYTLLTTANVSQYIGNRFISSRDNANHYE